MKQVGVTQFVKERGDNALVVDVRTPAEYSSVHVAGAVNLPLGSLKADQFTSWAELSGWRQEEPVWLLCKSGQRARMAADKLAAVNFDLRVVEGGTDACLAMGLDVVEGTNRVISLERQVRIVAGTLVLIGVVLGWFVTPAFFILSAFVGCGLIFAGITDTCAMGMLLSRMPWNKKGGQAACCSPSAH